MQLIDVNILINAHRAEQPDHDAIRSWLIDLIDGNKTFGVPELVMSGFIRIVTASKPFSPPSSTNVAFDFCNKIIRTPRCVCVRPGISHWQIFETLCRKTHARGNLIPDAYFAAMAMETGNEWVTTDRDFAKFPGLTWQHPLDLRSTTNPK